MLCSRRAGDMSAGGMSMNFGHGRRWCAALLACVVGCGGMDEDEPTDAESEIPSVPQACEGLELPLERGRGTAWGHFSTVRDFDLTFGGFSPAPDPEDGVLVFASHAAYNCSRPVEIDELSHTSASQRVFVLPGPIEPGTYESLSGWEATLIGSVNDGGAGAGMFDDGSLTISEVTADCVTGTLGQQGFAVSMVASCD